MQMTRRSVLAAVAGTIASLPFAAFAAMDAATKAKLAALIDGPQRSPQSKARDPYRHPIGTLEAFGLKDTMTVLEIWPGGGYWTEILAPLLKDKGRYIGAAPGGGPEAGGVQKFKDRLAKDPANYAKAEIVSWTLGGPPPGAPGTVDMVLTFRNIHNWMAAGQEKEMFAAMYAALKPGGYLGVEEHNGRTDQPQDPKAKSGYVRKDYALELIKGAGFSFVSESTINANPKDTKDYPKGVWTLPPTYMEGETDKAKYAAIGESDRFTLLFQKPAR